MALKDILALVHPALVIVVVYPLLGIVLNRALQVRQRRLAIPSGTQSKIPPTVGADHVQLGRWLSGSVVGLALVGLAHPLFFKMQANQAWHQEPLRVSFVVAMFVATAAALFCLYRAREKTWRAVFALLTGMGIVVLGAQPEIFRRDDQWYASHYYYGVAAALLMIVSLATIQEIYQDRQHRWRRLHIVLNTVALLFFVGQALTGTRDLLEIPLSWQESHLYQCDFANQVCP
ncbi:DUF4079 family protein [Synechococcales cyanobacterium C]|uniref:DUF4079 family protein n=1 Tax=Petrachloros mirabilis ULC683 TaxID=2781853 RepID=A0A8K1ZYK9_9CYAN|nr:DUF4079 domain-containing protein [Petrachloros mirabilis]NCJ06481.1 DUF4079 family protein [Petrachloros mirabilis ULC683]